MYKPVCILCVAVMLVGSNCSSLVHKNVESVWQGTWSFSSGTTEFSIHLYQDGDTIKGTHCAVMSAGNRIDCVDDNKFSITGKIAGNNKASVTFKNYSSLTSGMAAITKLTDTTIEWKILQEAAGENFIPGHVVLKKNTPQGLTGRTVIPDK